MSLSPVTACVLGLADPATVHRSTTSVVSALGRVIVGTPVDFDETLTESAEVLRCPVWSAAELRDALLAAAETPWALVLLAGERLVVDDEAAFAACLDGDAPALRVVVDGPEPLVPSPYALDGPRLVRPDVAVLQGEFPVLLGARIVVEPALPQPGTAITDWALTALARRRRERVVAEQQPDRTAVELADLLELAWAGMHDVAHVRAATLAAGLPASEVATAVTLGRILLGTALASGRLDEAMRPVTWLRTLEPDSRQVAAWTTTVLALSRATQVSDLPPHATGGTWADPWIERAGRGYVEIEGFKADRRADAKLERVRAEGDDVTIADFHELLLLWRSAGRSAGATVEAWPARHADRILTWLLVPASADTDWVGVLERVVEKFGWVDELPELLVSRAADITNDTAFAWTEKLRAAGYPDASPLLARAVSAAVPPFDRVVAGAVAFGTFGDESARPAVRDAAGLVPPTDFRRLLVGVDSVAPAALPDVVIGAATTSDRALALAVLHDEFGAHEQAETLRALASQG